MQHVRWKLFEIIRLDVECIITYDKEYSAP